MSDRKLINRLDVIFILVILLISVLFLCLRHFSSSNVSARIYVSGELVESVDLSEVKEPYDIPLLDGKVTLSVEPGCIYFKDSDCPDKLCVSGGKLTSPGDSAACVPERVVISVVGEKESGAPDIISY